MEEWQLQSAKQRFSELIRAVESEGPQLVTRHGKEVAVVIDFASYAQLSWEPDDLKDYLINGPTVDDLEISRDNSSAPVVDFE